MSVTKRKRDKPCKPRGVNSKGVNGATKYPLAELAKVLMGKGRMQSMSPVEMKAPWRGAIGFKEPFDAEQAKANRSLYPHLFSDHR